MASNPRPLTKDQVRPLFRWIWLTVTCMGITYLATLLLLPWRLIGLPFAVAGIVIGSMTTHKAFHIPGAGFLKFAAPLAVFSCGLFTIMLSGQAFFLGPSLEYQDCLKGALTLRSEAACKTTLQNQITPTFTGGNHDVTANSGYQGLD